MDQPKRDLLDVLTARLDVSVDEVARALVSQVDAFGPIDDRALPQELRELARQYWVTFLESARTERAPDTAEYEFARARAVQRAREMVPLRAQVRAYLVGIHAVMDTIARQAGPDAASRGAALELIGQLMESVVVAFSTVVDAYVETVQGERADREADRWDVLEEVLNNSRDFRPELVRRAAGLGLGRGPAHPQVMVIARVTASGSPESGLLSRRRASEAIGRATGRAATQTFIVVRSDDVVAVLDADGEHRAAVVVEHAGRAMADQYGILFTAGVGTPFAGVDELRTSYLESQRALRHTTAVRPVISSPGDISLFDDLTVSADPMTHALVPIAMRDALRDATLRDTLDAYIDADLNVAAAAKQLVLHPNSVRYRLRRIAHLTGRDPHNVKDLLELASAARIVDRDFEA